MSKSVLTITGIQIILFTETEILQNKTVKQKKREVRVLKVVEFMKKVGVPMHLKGYDMMRQALELKMDHMDWSAECIYSAVAIKSGCKNDAVERNIRTAISISYPHMDEEVKSALFGKTTKRPGTSMYITSVAYALKNKLI